MILKTNNSGSYWVFDDGECSDYAYICSCMPTDRMAYKERTFIGQVNVKFRNGSGGWLTEGQWNWFVSIGEKYSTFIQGQDDVAMDARALARQNASPAHVSTAS